MPYNPTKVRHRLPRVHLALCVLALFAALGSSVQALEGPPEEPYPAQITPPASLPTLPSSLVVDDSVSGTASADWNIKSHGQELRLRHRHLHHRRQNGGADGKDNDDKHGTKDGNKGDNGGSKTIVKNEHPTKDGGKGDNGGPKTVVKNEHSTKDDEDSKDGHRSTTKHDSGKTTKHEHGGGKTTTAEETKETGSGHHGSGTVKPTKTITDDPGSLTSSLSVAPSPTPSESNAPESPLPVPFDDNASSDFTDGGDKSCPNFINALLHSKTLKDCYPLSMLIQTSTGFFDARKQLTSTVRVLDESCASDANTCAEFMDAAAKNLTASENCEQEYKEGLSVVMQAYRGLVSYKTIYSVSCLEDPATDMYCFANAVTNLSTASDAYMYFLPYNLSLPGSSTPSCNWCNKKTMGIYHAESADRSLPIAATYEEAARQINNLCGPDWVNDTLPDPTESVGFALVPSWAVMVGTACLSGVLGSLL